MAVEHKRVTLRTVEPASATKHSSLRYRVNADQGSSLTAPGGAVAYGITDSEYRGDSSSSSTAERSSAPARSTARTAPAANAGRFDRGPAVMCGVLAGQMPVGQPVGDVVGVGADRAIPVSVGVHRQFTSNQGRCPSQSRGYIRTLPASAARPR